MFRKQPYLKKFNDLVVEFEVKYTLHIINQSKEDNPRSTRPNKENRKKLFSVIVQ